MDEAGRAKVIVTTASGNCNTSFVLLFPVYATPIVVHRKSDGFRLGVIFNFELQEISIRNSSLYCLESHRMRVETALKYNTALKPCIY